MAFGAAIRKLREDAGISVDKLTGRIGVSASRWRKWEEKDFDPRDEDQRLIEGFFGLSLKEIEQLNSIKEFLNVPISGQSEASAAAEPTTRQILSVLASAFEKQAEAQKEQAYALRLQAELMKNIEKNMARQDSQARIESNLNEVLTGVETIADRQGNAIKQILSDLSAIKSNKNGPSKG